MVFIDHLKLAYLPLPFSTPHVPLQEQSLTTPDVSLQDPFTDLRMFDIPCIYVSENDDQLFQINILFNIYNILDIMFCKKCIYLFKYCF